MKNKILTQPDVKSLHTEHDDCNASGVHYVWCNETPHQDKLGWISEIVNQ